ncbi:MAG: SHOCT domain-containing protein [Kofleriaceae bacterium]
MYWYQWSWIGMNLFWWLFWVALIVIAFGFAVPVPRSRVRLYEDPLATLARRYAAGELTTQEYDERRARLEQAPHSDVTAAPSAA